MHWGCVLKSEGSQGKDTIVRCHVILRRHVEVLLDVVRFQLLDYPVLFVRDFTRSLAEATA